MSAAKYIVSGHCVLRPGGNMVADCSDTDDGKFESDAVADAQRIAACLDACAGLADPVKAIAAARHAMTEAGSVLLEELEAGPEAILMRGALGDLNQAFELFGMEPETLPADPEEGSDE